jgi:hypothetical protein
MKYKIFTILLFMSFASCQKTYELKRVTKEQYSLDDSCWGGEKGRLKGVGVLSDTESPRFYLLSNRCSIEKNGYKYSALSHIGIIRISDRSDVLGKKMGNNFKIWDNFIRPGSMPDLDQNLYITDINVRKVNTEGFEFFEIEKVNKLKKTSLKYKNLIDNYDGSMAMIRAME